MRITAEAKQKTRDRILDTARHLFDEKGFEPTTTRDIASTAKIAAGTLFNYFPTKEALAMTILGLAVEGVRDEFRGRLRGDESLEEQLFLLVMCGLRRLEPYRRYTASVIEAGLSPFTESAVCPEGEQFRVDHLEAVAELIASNGAATAPSMVAVHLYWTLYLGVLAFWSRDESPNQEQTLALLDQSLRLFVLSLSTSNTGEEVLRGS